ncbi:MAG: hypothetical protein ACKVOG_12525 [Rhodoglobus sp.]
MSTTDDERVNEPRHPLLLLLAVLLFAECALLVGATVYLVVELLVATPSSLASALFLTLLTAIAAVWLGIIAVNTLRGSPWVRGAAITWQVLQLAVGIGSLQGLFAQPAIGWALVVPALVVLILVFTPPVVQATKRT